MKVKKYTAGTMPEVMNLIRKDLGPEAVILSSKEIKQGGFLGLFKKTKIEVFAGIDQEPLNVKKNKSINDETKLPKESSLKSNSDSYDTANRRIMNDISYMKKLIEQQAKNESKNFPPSFQLIYDMLKEQEVSENIAERITLNTMDYFDKKMLTPDTEDISRQTRLEIETLLKDYLSKSSDHNKKIIHFVGPTGVGKTTTLAKIAAKKMLIHNKSVAFITTDTYRIAAIDQLKTYAKILDVPVEVAYSTDEYERAIERFSSYDLILVDTAGRNYREDKYIKDMRETLHTGDHVVTYLVLSLTAKYKDLLDIQMQFQQLPIEAIIFTKSDETTQYGSILSVATEMDKPIAYITNGQNVPDDLIEPTPQTIADLIAGDFYHE